MKRHGADHMEMTVRRMRAPGDAKWIWGWKLKSGNLFFLEGGSAPQIFPEIRNPRGRKLTLVVPRAWRIWGHVPNHVAIGLSA